jgi:lysophospholipase L1-like esterase
MAKHRLVAIGDSITQGFMSGSIFRTDISFPVMLADAMGIRDSFAVPNFSGKGGLPLNLELLLNKLSDNFGKIINWWEVIPALLIIQDHLDEIEDFWERGKGSKAYPQRAIHHNLAVWGFEVGDAFTITEGVCRRAIPEPTDNLLNQVPEMPMYRTARRVLNPSFANDAMEWHQMHAAMELANDGGIENLIVFLGANNVLGTVTSLNIKYSTDADLHLMAHERHPNLFLPDHFNRLYDDLASWISRIEADNVFLGTVPHVTIPPVTRGVSPSAQSPKDTTDEDGYYEYYTRPWVWDNTFDPDAHQRLTREQARQIDRFIDGYNEKIKDIAAKKNWHVVDVSGMLDKLAYRRNRRKPTYEFPQGMVNALKANDNLSYLVEKDGEGDKVNLDTRFFMSDPNSGKIARGGLFSLDGIHPTTIGYGGIADLFFQKMKSEGVNFQKDDLEWKDIVASDTLVNNPPILLANLKEILEFLDKHAFLSSVIDLFN